ncbi:peroxisomal acyl-coenzyme A oxidase 3-like isoform X2 [Photinus pyralis]|uniref:peroxisomal acyl-coenzyme A oxidase 3-like isoform X2 n=1 Tax=Photinus pyralis TaxID=7054 RepID=UPI001266F3A5|nr:peroxisomal acyl-coenzyme A oxidase 3-like isoform X2 [Photinus pyralis]
MDTSFICDLPSGPLDSHRRNVSFDWKKLKLVFEKPQLLKLKLKIWNTLEEDPLFQRFDEEPTTQEQKRIAALQLQQFRKYKFMPISTNKAFVKDRARCLMSINEALAVVCPAVSVKQAIGVYLFQNTLTTLGTERHQHIIEELWNQQALSALALTEVAHGSDAKNMRTTATYDQETEEFVINTPDFQAAKCWVGNLGKTCTMVLLFAQLYTGGQCFGLHAFVVPVRDPKTLLPYPGLIIGDIGEKIGLNGIDNGFVMFQNYRIPRQNLLNRVADVTKDGDYESSFTEPGKLLGAALENLSAGRVGIMQEGSNNLINAVTIAVRYAALRTQFGSDNGPEVPIIEYQLHQWRLFPYVSAAAVLKIFTTSLTDDYLNAVEMSNTDTAIDNLREMISEIHAIISATKPLITWTCLHAIQECREACGGHGYLKAARFGDLRSTVDPCVSYEGDNNVLLQQTSNWLLRQWSSVINHNTTHSPLKTCSFLTNCNEILSKRFAGSSVRHVKTVAFVTQTYEWLITYLLKNTHQKQSELLTTQCKFTARNNSQVYKAAPLSKAYGEYVALKYYWNHINEHVEADLRSILGTLGLLYGLSCLDKHLVYLLQGNYGNGSLVNYIQDAILELCNEMKKCAVSVTDALAPPDFVINSVLGKADGKLYDNIQAEFFNNPNAMSRPTWWREIKLDDNPNLKLMSKL